MFEFIKMFYIECAAGFNYIVRDVTFAFCLVFVLTDFDKHSGRAWLSMLLRSAAVWASLVVLSEIYYALFGSFFLFLVCQAVVTVVYTVFFCKYDLLIKISTACTFYTVYLFCGNTGNILAELVYGYTTFKPPFQADVLWSVTTALMMVGTVFFVRGFSVKKYKYVPTGGVYLLTSYTVILFVLPWFAEKGEWWQIFVTDCLLLVILLISYVAFYFITKQYDLREQNLLIAKKIENSLEQVQLTSANYENIRLLRHDLKNQLAVMRLMLENKQYDKLQNFFSAFSEKALPVLSVVDCGNSLVNAIVNMEMSSAKANGIAIDSHIAVPKTVAVDDTDMCSLLCNLLDNAVESCVEDKMKGVNVVFDLKQQGKSLFVKVVNPILPSKEEQARELFTSKNKEIHGYGWKIINSIVEKYNGVVLHEVENGFFTATAVLTLTGEEC